MGILSGSIISHHQLLLSFTTTSSTSILLPPRLKKIQTLRTRTPTMCLKNHNNNNKLNLLVLHGISTSPSISLLSTGEEEEEDDSIITTRPFSYPDFGCPFASCHELLLTVRGEFSEKEKLALWDPSSKDFIKTLPQPPRPPPSVEYEWSNRLYGLGLTTDPAKTTEDDYKVIRVVELDYADIDSDDPCFMGYHVAELYSLKTDSWKRIPFPHANKAYPLRASLCFPVHINGFNYWPCYSGPCNEDLVIMSFDFANEIFPCALIPGPPGEYKLGVIGQYHFIVAEFEGSLALVVHFVRDKLFELWVWNKDDESWSRRGSWAIVDALYPLAFLKNHLLYFEDSVGELVVFDCAKQKLKNLGLSATKASMIMLPYISRLTRTT